MSSSSCTTKKAKAKDNNNNDDEGNSNSNSVDEPRKPSPRRTRSSTRIRKNNQAGSNPSFLNPTASSSARQSSARSRRQHNQPTAAASSTSASRTATAARKKPPTNNNNSRGDLKMSSKNNSNAAASRHSNNPPNDNNEEEVDPALQRLLDRLQREHSTNFGNNRPSGGGGVNRTRARYLLEASAGNVGLASALYWEDFIAEANEEEGGDGGGGGVMEGNDNNNESGLLGQGSGLAAAASSASAASGDGNNDETASGSAVARHGFGPPAKQHHPHADRKRSSSKKRKASGGSTADNDDNNNEPSKKKSKKRGLRGSTTDSMLARLKSSEDSTEDDNPSDEEDGRKPSAAAASYDRSLARARGEGLYVSETLRRAQARMDAASGAAAAAAAGGNAASAAGAGNDSELSAAAAEVLSRYPNLWYAASGPGGVNASGLAGALGAGSSPGRQLAGLFPNIYAAYGDPGAAAQGSPAGDGRRNAFVDAMNAALRSAGAAASSNNPSALLPGRGAAASSSAAAQGVGEGQSQLDYISRLLACNNNALAAAGSGADRRLDESEARALMAALAGDLAGTSGAASAAGAGGGGNGGDDSDNDSSNAGDDNNDNGPRRHGNNDGDEDNSRDDDEDAEDNAAAPLRRSIRVRNRSRAGRNPPALNPPVAAARRRNNNNNNNGDEEDSDEERPLGAIRRRALAAANRGGVARRAPDNNASADISDTEDDDVTFLPGPVPVFRILRMKKGGDDGDRGKSDKESKPKYSFEDSDNDGDDSDDESVDIDLLLHSSDAFAEPSTELWGSYPKHSPESDEELEDDSDTNDSADRVIIPVSWLRTGMKLSECGNGLAMNGPSDEDWERNRRPRSALFRDSQPLKGCKGTLFPHNCKGVSAVLSIVTALLYSGASVQGGTTVACDLERVPFDELTVEQRKREFDPRLVDALTSLIFIAAQAGKQICGKRLAAWESKWERHKKKGHPISPAEEDEYNTKRLSLQRRVGVCQVCWWEEDTTNGNTTVLYPENRDPYNVKFKTSFTSIQGLKSYVQTHLRSFKAPGGCALLLETILHCHGPYMPNKMSLLKCHCTESLDHLEKCAKTKNGLTPMPSDHDCVSTELLSLLLTGEFHSTLEDWSADMFGIGVLQQFSSQHTTPLNNRLIRPIKPIWICKGDLGYSVLFVDYKDFIGSTNSLEEPGKVFKMAHWNCWSGERTGFRVITSMHDERRSQIQPTLIISDSDDECTRTVSDSISSRFLLEQKRDEAMSWKQSSNDASAAANSKAHVNQDKPITDAELQAVSFHPEDEQYYPDFKRWRFRFGDSTWIPFYRLRGRQRLIVEMKLAPRICGIVRSRWPLATVRDFTAVKFPLL